MKTQSTYSIIPEGEVKCIWMDAGVTDFKLCDLDFKCETCEFYKIISLRQTAQITEEKKIKSVRTNGKAMTAEEIFRNTLKMNLENLRTIEIPKNRIYHRNHYWAHKIDDDKYRIGINHIVANLIKPVLSVVFPKAPTKIHKHDPFCWIILPGGTVTLRTPIDAVIIKFNSAIQLNPNLLNSAPFEDGWLMDISIKQKKLNNFIDSSNSEQLLQRILHNVEHTFIQAFRHHHPGAGTTLFDGGTSLINIENVLGSKAYLEVINRILHLPS